MAVEMSRAEITHLLTVAKEAIIDQLTLPSKGQEICFDVFGVPQKERFIINIFRGNINAKKYNINARFSVNNVMLMQLHISPTNRHVNPNGDIIIGDHWHIFDKDTGLKWAYPAANIQSDDFVDNTIKFLDKFKVIKRPILSEQIEL